MWTLKPLSYLDDKIIFRDDVLNSKENISAPSYRSKFYERSIKYNLFKVYNPIKRYMRNLNIFSFKKAVRQLYLSK